MTYFQHRSQGIFSKHKGSHVTPHSLPPSVKAQLCIMISRDLPSLPHAHLVHSSPTLFPIPSAQPALVLLPKYPGHPPDLCLSICCSLWLETSFYKLPHGSLSPPFQVLFKYHLLREAVLDHYYIQNNTPPQAVPYLLDVPDYFA